MLLILLLRAAVRHATLLLIGGMGDRRLELGWCGSGLAVGVVGVDLAMPEGMVLSVVRHDAEGAQGRRCGRAVTFDVEVRSGEEEHEQQLRQGMRVGWWWMKAPSWSLD